MVKNRLRNSMTNLNYGDPSYHDPRADYPSVPRFRRDSHPMAVMCGITGALAASITTRWMLTILVIVKLPRSAAVENADHGRDVLQVFHWSAIVYPRNDLSYAGNFLNMMFSRRANRMKLIRFWNVLWTVFCPAR